MSKEQGFGLWESATTRTILSRPEIVDIMIFNLVTTGYGDWLSLGATRVFHPEIDMIDFIEIDDIELGVGA